MFIGGLLQGEGLKEYCENFRRRMFNSAAAIFWMFNDCWPAVRTWTIVDYFLNRTPAFHFVRRAMNLLHVVVSEDEQQGTITIYGVNDTPHDFEGSIRHGIFRLEGEYVKDESRLVVLPANRSVVLASFESGSWKEDRKMPFAILTDREGNLVSHNRFHDKFFKDIQWPKPQINISLENGQAVFQSDTFALAVCIDLNGDEPLADNFFDLMPCIPHSIRWNKAAPPVIKRVGFCSAE